MSTTTPVPTGPWGRPVRDWPPPGPPGANLNGPPPPPPSLDGPPPPPPEVRIEPAVDVAARVRGVAAAHGATLRMVAEVAGGLVILVVLAIGHSLGSAPDLPWPAKGVAILDTMASDVASTQASTYAGRIPIGVARLQADLADARRVGPPPGQPAGAWRFALSETALAVAQLSRGGSLTPGVAASARSDLGSAGEALLAVADSIRAHS